MLYDTFMVILSYDVHTSLKYYMQQYISIWNKSWIFFSFQSGPKILSHFLCVFLSFLLINIPLCPLTYISIAVSLFLFQLFSSLTVSVSLSLSLSLFSLLLYESVLAGRKTRKWWKQGLFPKIKLGFDDSFDAFNKSKCLIYSMCAHSQMSNHLI